MSTASDAISLRGALPISRRRGRSAPVAASFPPWTPSAPPTIALEIAIQKSFTADDGDRAGTPPRSSATHPASVPAALARSRLWPARRVADRTLDRDRMLAAFLERGPRRLLAEKDVLLLDRERLPIAGVRGQDDERQLQRAYLALKLRAVVRLHL